MPTLSDNLLTQSYIWDPAIEKLDETSREIFARLFQNINVMLRAINDKETAIYNTQEIVNSQTFFSITATNSPRSVTRKVINFGALPNAGTTNVAHGITTNANVIFTRIIGCATDPAAQIYLPLPFSSPVGNQNILVSVNNTNVTITTAINYAAYNICYIVLEYIKV